MEKVAGSAFLSFIFYYHFPLAAGVCKWGRRPAHLHIGCVCGTRKSAGRRRRRRAVCKFIPPFFFFVCGCLIVIAFVLNELWVRVPPVGLCVRERPSFEYFGRFRERVESEWGERRQPRRLGLSLGFGFDDIRRNLIEINETKFPKKRWRQQVINRLGLRLFDSLTRWIIKWLHSSGANHPLRTC